MFFIVLLLLTIACVNAQRTMIERQVPKTDFNGWQVFSRAASSQSVTMDISLKTRDRAGLLSELEQVSNPDSPRYAQYYTLEQIKARFGRTDKELNAVVDWVRSAGMKVEKVSDDGAWVRVAGDVAAAEKMLQTEFFVWTHENVPSTQLIRAMSPYSAPSSLAKIIAFISNTHVLPLVAKNHAKIAKSQRKRQTNADVTPAVLRQVYNMNNNTGLATHPKNSQAVAEFQSQFYSPSDLSTFFQKYVTFAPPNSDRVAGVRPPNSNNPNAPGIEASLDIEYIMGVTPGVPTYFYASSTFDFWSGLTAWAALLASDANPPLVHSVSYGDQSAFSKPSQATQQKFGTEFAKLGLRGISIIFASGDSGAGCTLCLWDSPSFPATSPFVTSVGALRFTNGVGSEQMCVESFGSGGGFSWDLPMPAYQKTAVQSYLKTASNLPYAFQYNPNGRATPDVSAMGIGFQVLNGGSTLSIGGTSASAPTFAAIVTALNDERLKQNKKPLGFLNPWIYATAARDQTAFVPITKGNNDDSCCRGFPSQANGQWNACAGVGHPNFGVLLKYI